VIGQDLTPNSLKKYLAQAMSLITEEAPACFMWRHKLLWGISDKVDYQPPPDAGIFGLHIKVRR